MLETVGNLSELRLSLRLLWTGIRPIWFTQDLVCFRCRLLVLAWLLLWVLCWCLHFFSVWSGNGGQVVSSDTCLRSDLDSGCSDKSCVDQLFYVFCGGTFNLWRNGGVLVFLQYPDYSFLLVRLDVVLRKLIFENVGEDVQSLPGLLMFGVRVVVEALVSFWCWRAIWRSSRPSHLLQQVLPIILPSVGCIFLSSLVWLIW